MKNTFKSCINKHKLLCFLLLCFSYFNCNAQTIQRQVFSNGGISNSDTEVTLSSTIGEPVANTFALDSILLRQGFEQPIKDTAIATFIINDIAVEISVFPNPTTDFVNIQWTSSSQHRLLLELFNINGQQVLAESMVSNQHKIEVRQLPAATYLLRIRDPESQQFEIFKIEKIN